MTRHRETWIDPHGYVALNRILIVVLLLEVATILVGASVLLARSAS